MTKESVFGLRSILQKSESKKEVQQQIKQRKKIGSYLLRPGHTMFEYNESTKMIRKLTDEDYQTEIEINEKGETKKKLKLMIKEGMIYRSALNYKNATKVFNRLGLPVVHKLK